MTTKTFINYTNETYKEQCALVEVPSNKVLLMGDYYHDKIDETIAGFLDGVQYCGFKTEVTSKTIGPKDPLFDIIGFINKNYDEDDEEVDEE